MGSKGYDRSGERSIHIKSNYGPMWNKSDLLAWHQLEMWMIVFLSVIFCQAPMVVQAKSVEVSAQWPRDTYGK